MSYDSQNIKSRNSKNYFELYNINKLNKNNNNNLMTIDTSTTNNMSEDKKVIKYRNTKQITVSPHFSTLESTNTSHFNENDEENIITKENQKIYIKSKKIAAPKDEDMVFLYEAFFKTNRYSAKYFFNKRRSESIEVNFPNKNIFNNGNINNYNFFAIKKYLINLQKNFKIYENSLIVNNKSKIKDNNSLQKLEDLITRYILIIHIFIRCSKLNDAKKLFLLLIKENFYYINYIENQIYINYTERNKKINISKDIPQPTYQLLKIYSLIIRYSRLFNLNKYRNIFLSKYLKMQLLNFKFFILKGNYRGVSYEIRNQIKYLFSYCFHCVFYYCIENYLPMNIPIILNSSIISLYNNQEESYLTDLEKSLLIKTLYNQGVLYYIDNNLEEALISLKHSKDKIISFGDDCDIRNKKILNQKIRKENSLDLVKNNKKDSILSNNSNINENQFSPRMDNIRKRANNDGNDRYKINELFENVSNNNSSSRKYSIISLDGKKPFYELSQLPKIKNEKIVSKMNENLKKNKISINDVEFLLNFGKDNMLLNDDSFSVDKNFGNLGRSKGRYNSHKKTTSRASHIDFRTSMRIKNFNIPEKFKNPLLRNIELLMSFIELQKKNFEESYAHILKLLYIIIILKLGNSNNEFDKNFFNQQKIQIDKYFEMISKIHEIYIKHEKISKISCYDNNINVEESKEFDFDNKLNNRNNNISSQFLKNKNIPINFFQKYINSSTNELPLKANNIYKANNNFNVKAILEFKKFFIFLTGLSLYQIKILNENQPESDKRNNLPIVFSNQFKDCLTMSQRIELDKLHTMALNRFIILKDPNKWIIPSNLNIALINDNKKLESDKRQSYYLSPFERYNYIDEKFIQTKEYKNYLRIVNSRKCSRDIRDFLIKNRKFVIKIIADVDDQEINSIVDYPYVIIDPIKKFKRRMKKKLKNTRNLTVKNHLDNIIRRNNKNARMKTVTINSRVMTSQITRAIQKKLTKRNLSIATDSTLLKTFVKKKRRPNNNSYDSYSFDDFSLNND